MVEISFHPISAEFIGRFVFEVLVDPALAGVRATELTADPAKQAFVREGIYRAFGGLRAQLAAEPLKTPPAIAFAAAALGGYRHAFWWSAGSALAVAARHRPAIASLFIPLTELPQAPAFVRRPSAASALLAGAEGASGYLPPAAFRLLRAELDGIAAQRSAATFALFDDRDREALDEALRYAEVRGLGLIEAAGLVQLALGRCSTDADRLRWREGPASAEALDPTSLQLPRCLGGRGCGGHVADKGAAAPESEHLLDEPKQRR